MGIAGYIAAAFVGLSLGLIGGGGSILTVPVLVYLFRIDAMLATSYSLFIVGSTSFIGAVRNYLRGQLELRTALSFGASSVVTVLLTRRFIIPAIPAELFSVGSFVITKQLATIVLFALLMVAASVSMIRGRAIEVGPAGRRSSFVVLVSSGILIGMVTGLLGAGGGFLLIPALVTIFHLPVKRAIGTSLLIIAMNSLVGFAGDLGHFKMEWSLLFKITLIAVAGLFAGLYLNERISAAKLKKGFGWFVLIIGVFILVREMFG